MNISLPLWTLPCFSTVLIFIWICKGFDYGGSYNFTSLFTLPLGAFLTAIVWLFYFVVMYVVK